MKCWLVAGRVVSVWSRRWPKWRAKGGSCMDSGGVQEMAAYGSKSFVRRSGARGLAVLESVWCVGNFRVK